LSSALFRTSMAAQTLSPAAALLLACCTLLLSVQTSQATNCVGVSQVEGPTCTGVSRNFISHDICSRSCGWQSQALDASSYLQGNLPLFDELQGLVGPVSAELTGCVSTLTAKLLAMLALVNSDSTVVAAELATPPALGDKSCNGIGFCGQVATAEGLITDLIAQLQAATPNNLVLVQETLGTANNVVEALNSAMTLIQNYSGGLLGGLGRKKRWLNANRRAIKNKA